MSCGAGRFVEAPLPEHLTGIFHEVEGRAGLQSLCENRIACHPEEPRSDGGDEGSPQFLDFTSHHKLQGSFAEFTLSVGPPVGGFIVPETLVRSLSCCTLFSDQVRQLWSWFAWCLSARP